MKNYPRKTNRFFLFLIGLILCLLSALAIGFLWFPMVGSYWRAGFSYLKHVDVLWIAFNSHTHGAPILLLMLVLLILVAYLILTLLVCQGGGRKQKVVRVKHNQVDALSVAEVSFIADFLDQKLSGLQVVHGVSVSAWKLRKNTPLKISLTVKQGANPAVIRPLLDQALSDLDSLFGMPIPVLVYINRPWLERKPARVK